MFGWLLSAVILTLKLKRERDVKVVKKDGLDLNTTRFENVPCKKEATTDGIGKSFERS
jgi:hypothetical protein